MRSRVHADVELLLTGWLRDRLGALAERVLTDLPADLEAHLPTVALARTGGGADRFRDLPVVDVDVYAATRQQAVELANLINDLMLHQLPGAAGSGATVQTVAVQVGPRRLPYDNPVMTRYSQTVRLAVVPNP